MNKDVEQHLQELIEFYSNTDIKDIEYLKKLFVRNLKDVQRRYVKYDKPRKEQLNKAIEYIKSDDFWLSQRKAEEELLEILGDKE